MRTSQPHKSLSNQVEWKWETELSHLDVLGVEMEEGADIQLAPDLKIIFQATENAINAPGVCHHWGFQNLHFKRQGIRQTSPGPQNIRKAVQMRIVHKIS